jgi:hypothetical protein
VAICRWRTKQNLTGTLALKTRRRLYVYEIHNYGNSFTPEMSRDKRRNAILSMSTRTRQLGKGTLGSKKLKKGCKEVLPLESEQKTRITLEN